MTHKAKNQTQELIDTISKGLGNLAHGVSGLTKIPTNRVTSLTPGKDLASGTVIEAVGIPLYVDDVNDYAAYGLTETGWYVFARILAEHGNEVTAETEITGAAGYIAAIGSDHVDVAVRFDVAAASQKVIVDWGTYEDTFIFKATDLAVRNLDYRTTFYIYDLARFVTWSYALTADAAFVGTVYYTEDGGVYTQAAVKAGAAIPENTYYVHSYALTEDTTFQEGKVYYTLSDDVYSAATVTAGEAVAENTYYEDVYTLTTDKVFGGSKYFVEDDGEYEQAAVKGGEAVPVFYKDEYTLTEDATFQENKTYYTEDGGVYSEATVTPGDAVTAETYYEHSYVRVTGEFEQNVAYYTKAGDVYSAATVTPGDAVPEYYVHSKVTISGMTRNVTYVLNETIDCPQEYVLPEIEDDTHGCWFEFRLRHSGSFSSELIVPEGVKVATEHTQAETAGLNMVNLHYTKVDGVKLWRFMNTHSSIPT